VQERGGREDARVDRVHRRRRPREDQLEERDHDGGEQQRSGDRVQHDAVDRVGQAVGAGPHARDVREHRIGPVRPLERIARRQEHRPAPVLGPA
jgi:hypothetical protein